MATASTTPPPALPNRITSLDQFRGYTVFGMFLVNYMGSYKDITPNILLHHHTYTSYADLIMPHFIFCVGFAFRLTFGRRDYKDGPYKAYARVIRRILGLMLVTFSVYHISRPADTWAEFSQLTLWEIFDEPLKRTWTATLGQIAMTSLWILPWLRTSIRTRVMFMVGSGLAHMIGCYYGYFHWVNDGPSGIDGGSFGFLTWAIPAILGTIACDWVVNAREASPQRHAPLGKMIFWSLIVMLVGWLITFPARSYDISPTQMAVLKESLEQDSYRRRDVVNGRIGELNHPLNEQLKPFNEAVGKLAAEVQKQDFDKKQEIVARMMEAEGLNPETDYAPKWISDAAVEEWETKYVENYEGELGELHRKLDYWQDALAPEKMYLSGEEEALKQDIARTYEDLLAAEVIRRNEIRNEVLTAAGLDPETAEPNEEQKKQINEKFAAEREQIATDLRARVAELKPKYLETLSPYYDALEKARSQLPETTAAPAEGEAPPKSEQQLLVENLEARTEIDWNSVAAYERRDLKLAAEPVAFNTSEYAALPLSKKIGRNPMEKPPEEDERLVQYHPRDTFFWNAWMMSQRAGTVAYPTFAGGVSLLLYTLFYIACDMKGWQVPLFRTWGTNALAGYVLFGLVCGAVKSYVPRDPVWWYGWGSWVIGMFLMWLVIRTFEKNRIFIRM